MKEDDQALNELIQKAQELSDEDLARAVVGIESDGFSPGFDKEMFYNTEKLIEHALKVVGSCVESCKEKICSDEKITRYRQNKDLQNRIQAVGAVAGIIGNFRSEFFGVAAIAAAELTTRCYLEGMCK